MASNRIISRASRAVAPIVSSRTQYASKFAAGASRWHAPSRIQSRALVPQLQQIRRISDSQEPAESKPSTTYDFSKVKELVLSTSSDAKPILIDVREPHEFADGHIPGAINLPVQSQPDALFLSEEQFEDRFGMEKPKVTDAVVFYCKAGVRSKAAAEFAKRNSYKNVGEYPGSWLDWVKNGGEESKP